MKKAEVIARANELKVECGRWDDQKAAAVAVESLDGAISELSKDEPDFAEAGVALEEAVRIEHAEIQRIFSGTIGALYSGSRTPFSDALANQDKYPREPRILALMQKIAEAQILSQRA